MRVVQVMESTIGGTRRHIRDLCAGQVAAGLEVHLVASTERQPAFREDLARLRDLGVGVTELPMVRDVRPVLDARHAARVGALLRELRPQIVHTHSSKGGAIGRVASIRTRIGARVHTPHTFAFLFSAMFSPAKRCAYRTVEQVLGRFTQRVVAVGESEAETIRASGVVPPDRVRVVPNGIDPAPFEAARPASREALGVPPDAPLLVVVGLLNLAKGQDLALAAIARPGLEDAHLLIVGHGETDAALRDLARRLDVADRAHFLGWRTDVASLITVADVLVLPSRWEGLPYVVLEAMAARKPVVATRVDGARELVVEGETGFLADPESPESLAAALSSALDLDAVRRERIGEAGHERLLAGYTVDRMVERLTAVYEEVA